MASAYTVQSRNIYKTWILIFFFVGLVTAGFYAIGWYFDSFIWPIIGLVFSLSQALIGFFFGDKIALSFAKAKEVSPQQAPEIHNLTENIATIAGVPKPKIYISPDKSANAFAAGRDPKHAVICLNQGIIDLLDKNELEGVIAHEMAHIKNRDILVMTMSMVLASLVSFIADIGIRLMFFGGGDNRNKSPILIFLYLAFIILAPIVAFLIQMAISRSREYLADATAVVFTRYPSGLIGALKKLEQSPVPTSNYSTAMNHFYIAEPKRQFGKKAAGLFSTHPPVKDRIAKLSGMA